MILKRFYHDRLAQASYLIGCPGVGQAIVIDPNRNVEQYIRAAQEEGLRIVAVTETHIHADYLSGARELAQVAHAKLLLSDEGTEDWKYGYASDPNVVLIKDGSAFTMGSVRFEVRHTPGHTPEHVSFLITDLSASQEPLGMISGDFVFVGEVGRPDLLETAAGQHDTAAPAAHELYRSLANLAGLPDHLLIWPGHGAGSACGKSLGGVPVSSLGYERRSSWAFRVGDESSFVEHVLSGQPDPPKYFAEMKRLNKQGPPEWGGIDTLPQVRSPGDAIPVDIRDSDMYLKGHAGKALHIPFNKSFLNWAGWLLPYGKDLCLIADNEQAALEAARELAMIGLDQVTSWMDAWDVEEDLRGTAQISMRAIDSVNDGIVVDVRRPEEWAAGHVPGAVHAQLGKMEEALADIPRDTKVYVHCQGGVRSVIAASVLERIGFTDVVNVVEGFRAYPQHSAVRG